MREAHPTRCADGRHAGRAGARRNDGRSRDRVLPAAVPPDSGERRWWGKGFTEWTNVRRARPMFPGHEQPRDAGRARLLRPRAIPASRRRRRRSRARTASTASATTTTGSTGADCSSGRSTTCSRAARPTSRSASAGRTRTGRGAGTAATHEVLMAQRYSVDDSAALFDDVPAPVPRPALHPRRRPPAVPRLQDASSIPELAATAAMLARVAPRQAGIGDPYLVAVRDGRVADAGDMRLRRARRVPAASCTASSGSTPRSPGSSPDFAGRRDELPRAGRAVAHARRRPAIRRSAASLPSWDNTRAAAGARDHVRRQLEPELFGYWVEAIGAETRGAFRAATSACCSSTRGTNGARAAASSPTPAINGSIWKRFAMRSASMRREAPRESPPRDRRAASARRAAASRGPSAPSP